MKIVRNGQEFSLTPEELFQAYLEQEAIFDRNNITENMEGYLSPEFYSRVKDNESFIKAATNKLRENQDKYDMSYDSALTAAFKDTSKDFLLPVNHVTIIRERYSEHDIWNDDFWVDASKTPTKELFQEAVEAFLMTEDGQKAVKDTCNDFNWGDAMMYVPEEVWNQFGIYSLDISVSPAEMGLAPTSSANSYKILVDQDEVLIPSDYLDRLEALKEKKPSLSSQIESATARSTAPISAERESISVSLPEL